MRKARANQSPWRLCFPSQVASQEKVVAALQRQWYGATLALPAAFNYQDYLQTVMCVAAGDGLDASEVQWLRDRMVLLGLEHAQIEALFKRKAAPALGHAPLSIDAIAKPLHET